MTPQHGKLYISRTNANTPIRARKTLNFDIDLYKMMPNETQKKDEKE